ncbi:MAG: winged helix-turn-helix domain-containing protein [Candidatus Dormibacteraeota bacterium]|nr:winged helix-turn-helix domain-containing protein [Candidatus Dormibacteraeota bacterium]
MAPARVLLIGLDSRAERDLQFRLTARGHRPLATADAGPALREAAAASAAVVSSSPGLIQGLQAAAPWLIVLALCASPDAALGALARGAEQTFPPTATAQVVAGLELSLERQRPRLLGGPPRTHRCGDLVIDPSRQLVARSGRPLHLTSAEFALLLCLLAAAGRAVSRERILEHLGAAAGFDSDSRLVDVHVRNLRKKIEMEPGRPDLLLSVPGIGYRLRWEPIVSGAGTGSGSAA